MQNNEQIDFLGLALQIFSPTHHKLYQIGANIEKNNPTAGELIKLAALITAVASIPNSPSKRRLKSH